jgi:hypothetical protein
MVASLVILKKKTKSLVIENLLPATTNETMHTIANVKRRILI